MNLTIVTKEEMLREIEALRAERDKLQKDYNGQMQYNFTLHRAIEKYKRMLGLDNED